MKIQDATALVTGGSSGIGLAIAEMLVEAGARVAITGRDERRLQEAAQALRAHPVRADVANEADVIRTYRDVLDKFGHLDILINNAGIGAFKNLVELDKESFEAVFATNVTGAMLMAREAARHFISRNSGNIVNRSDARSLR